MFPSMNIGAYPFLGVLVFSVKYDDVGRVQSDARKCYGQGTLFYPGGDLSHIVEVWFPSSVRAFDGYPWELYQDIPE